MGFVDDMFHICRIRQQYQVASNLEHIGYWMGWLQTFDGDQDPLVRNSFHGTVPVLGVTWPVNRVEERCN
jgi:hypothetical protein